VLRSLQADKRVLLSNMLLMTGIDPMRFAVVCDVCGLREEALEGARPEVLGALRHRSWRISDDAKLACPDCAGPPSVFPTGRLTPTTQRCSACGEEADVCVACRLPFGGEDLISCRGEYGHVHARCSTQKLRRFVLPERG
jgi:hypothetical protein